MLLARRFYGKDRGRFAWITQEKTGDEKTGGHCTGDGSLCCALQSFASRSKNFSSAVLQTAACPLANPVCFVTVNSRTVNPIDISNKVKVIEI